MENEALRSVMESLGDALTEHVGNAFANFSSEELQEASALIGAPQPHSAVLAINRTMEEKCKQQADLDEILYPTHTVSDKTSSAVKTSLHCPTSFDSVLCWPRTNAGSWSILHCFGEYNGVKYDATGNATRFCHVNGTWDHYSNYTSCQLQSGSMPVIPDFSPNIDLPSNIYACGYFISLATLLVALIIFLSFKDLRCLRNTIHANLFLTYITSALLWILTLFLQVITTESSQAGCITLVIMFQYFFLTNFFWMFVEGLYLYTLVVQTFSSENISFVIYALIGWGCPAVCILFWSIAKPFDPPSENEENEHSYGVSRNLDCGWMNESPVDWLFKGPASFAILINLVFLIRIMWVLITKLRSAHTLETRQYYKASKALLVLIPLFGITYLLVLTGPESGISRSLFESIRAILISTQGFFVALFYCFLNSEVRQTLRHRFIRWRESRNIHRSSSLKNRRLTSTSPVPAGHYE